MSNKTLEKWEEKTIKEVAQIIKTTKIILNKEIIDVLMKLFLLLLSIFCSNFVDEDMNCSIQLSCPCNTLSLILTNGSFVCNCCPQIGHISQVEIF